MHNSYDRNNLFFSFPETWILDDENAPDSVTVLGPNGSFWCVRRESSDTPLESIFSQATDAMRQEYAELEVESTRDTIEGITLAGIDLHFFCLDLTGTASIRVWDSEDAKLVIFTQAEDQQLQQVQSAFNAITASLVRGREDRPIAN